MFSFSSTQPFEPIVLYFGVYAKKMNDQDFFEFCQLNQDVQLELTSKGDLIISSLNGGNAGSFSFKVNGLFSEWVEKDDSGVGFCSTAGFRLPNGAMRSPDFSWVKKSRWDALTVDKRNIFPPLCPDFVVDIRFPIYNLNYLHDKMQEYIENGAQLGWLIDLVDGQVLIYRLNCEVETIQAHAVIKGDPVLPGFVLDTRKLW